MTVDLRKVQRTLNQINRSEDKALAALQRYFEKDSKPSREIKFTTSLSFGGNETKLGTETVVINQGGKILNTSSQSQRISHQHNISLNDIGGRILNTSSQSQRISHQHNISWDDIDRAYKLQEAIHQILVYEYEKEGKTYGGRRLYSDYEKNNIKNINGLKIIDSKGSHLLYGKGDEFGYLGKYKANDIAIHQRVLEKIYSQVYKETDKHLLDKFNTVELDGDFKKLIKVTQELIYDIKKVKGWSKEVERLVKSAELKYKAQVKELQRAQREFVPDYIISIEDLEKIGRAILGRSTELCPIETGFLRSSGKLYVSNNSIRIIYECPYAAYVHDSPNMNHPVGEDHFLEKAAQEILPSISVWTNMTGDDSFILGNYMAQTWAHDEKTGHAVGDMYWKEQKGYKAVYIDIDRNLKINYYHYK